MGLIRAVIFDLDGVLLDERQYAFAAYRKIASFLSERCGISELQIYTKLVDDLRKKTSMYPRLFNDVVTELGLGQELVPEILKIYSSVEPKLELFSGAATVLESLREQKVKLGLVTNGLVAVQRNKMRLLNLEPFFDAVIYARETGHDKPSPEAYEAVLAALGVKPDEVLCVGDNPYTDFFGAKRLGMHTARLLCGEFKDVKLSEDYEAEHVLYSLKEVPSFVT